MLFEGGARLMSWALAESQIDYLLLYQAPVLLGDERARTVLGGFRTEKLAHAIRLCGVRRQVLGDDSLVRGAVSYPGKIQVDETLSSLG